MTPKQLLFSCGFPQAVESLPTVTISSLLPKNTIESHSLSLLLSSTKSATNPDS